ncbi:hypothetical protein ASZ95_03115 [Francisella tularensis]|uniref:AAA family ATPase n=1 Tax=Francisella tularensis TaxID=263 RepID=UPI000828B454|nr:AAA family ATPase [Francisella tularensis]OCQ57291.1 hypothetical protein ASZ95_03115 [Francisella tularensis]
MKEGYSLEELRRILEVYPSNEVFEYFYNALLSEMITDIQIFFNDDNLTIGDLSEGEKKLLLLKAAFEFVAQEDSLFMLDEPDSHIHLDNKKHIIDILEQYKDNRQFIVMTHSPTLTKCIKDLDNDNENRVYVLDNGKNISTSKTKQIEHLVGDFWNSQEQTVFLSSHKNMVLLVEGKHDKEHIINAWKHYKNDYPTLDFDVFSMDCAENISQLLTGLRTSEFQDRKKYVGIFDNDEAGINACNHTQVKYLKNKQSKKCKNKFFAITYSKPENYKEKHWTVESLLPLNKYESIYKKAIETHSFEAKKIDDISHDIQKRVKGMLADESKNYSKQDLIEFKKIFDILNEINNIGKQPQPQDISNKEDHIKQKVKEKNEVFRIGNLITEITDAKTYEESFIPIYGSYKNKVIEAKYDLNSKKVVYNDLVGSPSAMANQAVWDMGAPKTSTRNGLTFWKYEKGRDLKDLHEKI